MKKLALAVLLSVSGARGSLGAQTATQVDVRTAVRVRDRRTSTSARVIEGSYMYHRIIAPHVGYQDSADPKAYREFFFGGGYKFLENDDLDFSGEVYFIQTAGSHSNDARFIQPSSEIAYSITHELHTEALLFAYIPVSAVGNKQFVVEHVKVGFDLLPVANIALGYGAYQAEHDEWRQSPVVSFTLTPSGGRLGSIELWYQPLAFGGQQAQLRYKFRRSRKPEVHTE